MAFIPDCKFPSKEQELEIVFELAGFMITLNNKLFQKRFAEFFTSLLQTLSKPTDLQTERYIISSKKYNRLPLQQD